MKKERRGVDTLVYLFDHMVSDYLGYPYRQYVKIIDSMNDDDSMFVMEAVFDYITAEEEDTLTPEVCADFDEAKHIFEAQRQALESENN